MNPKVSPSAKNLPPFPGKKRVFRKHTTGIPSQIKESGISSHITDGQKPTTANYDLSLLDVVPAGVKNSPVKTKHVHFLPEDTYISSRSTDLRQAKSNKGHDAHQKYQTSRDASNKAKKHNGCTSARVRTNDKSDSLEVLSTQPKIGKASTRRGSELGQGDHAAVIVQRSNSLTVEHNKHYNSSESALHKHHSKPNSPMTRTKDKRSLPATPASATALLTTTTVQFTTATAQFTTASAQFTTATGKSHQEGSSIPLVAPHKTAILSGGFNKSVLHLPASNSKVCSLNNIASNSVSPKQAERKSSNPEPRQEACDNANSKAPHPETSVPYSDAGDSYKRSNSLSPPTKHKHSKAKSKMAGGEVHTTMVNGDVSNCRSSSKQSSPTQGSGGSVSDHHNTRGLQLDQRQRMKNIGNKDSTNQPSPVKLHNSSRRQLDQTGINHRCRFVAGNQNLTASSSPSSSIGKEGVSAGVYTTSSMSPTPRTRRSYSERLAVDSRLLFPLSTSSLSVSPSLSTSSSHTRSRSSPSCFSSDCVSGTSLDSITTTELSQPFHSLSRLTAGKGGDSRLSDLGGVSRFLFDKAPLYDYPITRSKTNRDNQSSKTKKQSIAASYQLDQCWFCGRPMPAFGTSLSGDTEQVDKLADLERRLAEALSEKVKLAEKQTRLKRSERRALQQNQQLQQELQQLKDKPAQEVPVTGVPSTPTKDLDLRAYIESRGHQLDICQHVQVTLHCCRGFLHKMGSHFHIWKKRWFVFDKTRKMVSYFTDKTERKLRGTLCFQTILEVYLDHPRAIRSPDPKLTFCVKTYQRTFYLMAPSAVAMAIWIDVLLSGAEGYKSCYGN